MLPTNSALPGLDEAWWKIDLSAKENFARCLARFCSDVFDVQMELIGSPFEIHDPDRPMTYLGPSASGYFVTRNPEFLADRGPFASARSFAVLDAAEEDAVTVSNWRKRPRR